MNRIKELRAAADIKQSTLAAYLHIGISTLSNWENDKSEPDISALIKIADFFNVTLDYLVKRTDINLSFK